MKLGELLIEKGLISQKELEHALVVQHESEVPIGKMAVDEGLIGRKDNLALLKEQIRTKKRYGDIAVEHGLLTHEQVDKLNDLKKADVVALGEVLLETTSLTKLQLVMAIKEYIELNEAV